MEQEERRLLPDAALGAGVTTGLVPTTALAQQSKIGLVLESAAVESAAGSASDRGGYPPDMSPPDVSAVLSADDWSEMEPRAGSREGSPGRHTRNNLHDYRSLARRHPDCSRDDHHSGSRRADEDSDRGCRGG